MEFQLYYDFARSSEIIGFARSSVICLHSIYFIRNPLSVVLKL